MNDPVVTPFQNRVYEAVARIPLGRVTTYAQLGKSIGCNCPRAVGQALRRNPFAPDVPCHRVIAADLTPGGYNGRRGGANRDRKLALLASEGVTFKHGRLADPVCLFSFPGGRCR